MNGDLQDIIAEELGVGQLPGAAGWWTASRASKAADTICDVYPNVSTCSTALSALRAFLRKLGASDEAVAATARPELTRKRNQLSEERLKVKTEEGVQIPDQYKDTTDLRARINVFLRAPAATASSLADFLVTFSARKNEALTLKLVNHQLSGVLKKRGKEELFDIVSCMPIDLCERFLTAWNKLSLDDRQAAIRALDRTCKRDYGCKVQGLREVGAYLASRQGASEGQRIELTKRALRHNIGRSATVEHYTTIVDPHQDLLSAAQGLDDDEHDKVLQFIKKLKR